jgi:hypothetical protein
MTSFVLSEADVRILKEVIREVRGQRLGIANSAGMRRQPAVPPAIVAVKNTTADTVARFGVIGLDVPTVLPTDSEEQFLNNVAFDGVDPTFGEPFGVTQEEIAPNGWGRVMISGTSFARVTGKAGLYCGPITDEKAAMDLGRPGCRVIWSESGTAERWAVVNVNEMGGTMLVRIASASIAAASHVLTGKTTGDAYLTRVKTAATRELEVDETDDYKIEVTNRDTQTSYQQGNYAFADQVGPEFLLTKKFCT